MFYLLFSIIVSLSILFIKKTDDKNDDNKYYLQYMKNLLLYIFKENFIRGDVYE